MLSPGSSYIREIAPSTYKEAFIFHQLREEKRDPTRVPTGKETAEEQPDQLPLRVNYFF